MDNSRKELPRTLVITVSGWSNSVGSDTMSTLFSHYDPDKLASLYIRAEISDSPVCYRYFHIIEGRVIRSVFNRREQTGEAYFTNTLSFDNKSSEELENERAFYARFQKHRPWPLVIGRELVWKFGKWKTKELMNFLDEFKPEVVFFPIEGYIHLDRIIEFVIDYCKPRKVVCNLWDDNFTYKQSNSLGYKLHRFWLRKHYRKIVEKGDVFIALNNKMQKEFKQEFGKDSIVLTKPIFNFEPFTPYQQHNPIQFLYTGSLYINRDNTILSLSKYISNLNADGIKIILDIYTGSALKDDFKKEIEQCNGCYLRGYASQNEIFKKQKEADVLLFVEDLSDKNLSARLSFSTKITDYFRAGKCVLAIGNSDLAPIEYFKEKNAGIVCTTEQEIGEALHKILNDETIIQTYARAAYECGMNNHNGDNIINQLHKILTE